MKNFMQQTTTIVYKDLLIEWQSRARAHAMVFFAALVLLLFSLAVGPQATLLYRLAPSFVWLALLLAGVLGLGESMRLEYEQAALEGLLLLRVQPTALFLGKAIANTLMLLTLSVVLLPVSIALYDYNPHGQYLHLCKIFILGSMAISAPGTLYAAMTASTKAQGNLLPLLLFPIVIPALVASVKTTTLLIQGDPLSEYVVWQGLLVGFNIIYWMLGSLLFGKVVAT